jgi:large subunit ribosomal protein L5
LVSITIPRIRDFRGLLRKSFDGFGNYTLGIKEQIVFMEIDRDKVSRITGMDICICTTASSDKEGLALLEEMGMPYRK